MVVLLLLVDSVCKAYNPQLSAISIIREQLVHDQEVATVLH